MGVIVWKREGWFCLFSMKWYVVTPHLNRLVKMRDHNICFNADFRDINPDYHQILLNCPSNELEWLPSSLLTKLKLRRKQITSQEAHDVKWRHINVDATWLRRIDIDTTSFWHQMPTGIVLTHTHYYYSKLDLTHRIFLDQSITVRRKI